ncbi:asparagine synthase-related protein [Gramella sp. AN32]|uniref:asparagine synthase (glutamine-hydrolyzing) n=1 Tax=Christiangramia antarctica TaxID=2058158 RepID=A0ABW5X7P8_9FLAO|nr:asparagine synthase-related protein [Gramella sp. AN32]MCM4154673.1 hypothetical protein [Gramella sp. AN32]
MKFIFSNKNLNPELIDDYGTTFSHEIESFHLKINDQNCIDSNAEISFITDGYVLDLNEDSSKSHLFATKSLIKNWPPPNNITGTFCSFIIDSIRKQLIISSDLIGIYPLYYLIKDNNIFISNSIILIGRYSNAGYDQTGIFQKSVGPNFINLGSRTILKDCKQLLPGEQIKFDYNFEIIEKKYDNSLYQNISNDKLKSGMVSDYWDHFKKEVNAVTKKFDEVNIALSGGIDSRIALASIPDSKKINCLTFGHKDNYEAKIASKLAKVKNAEHHTFYHPELYFPSYKILEENELKTEAVNLNSWLEILENVDPKIKKPLIFGELCEGLPARNISQLSSLKSRKDNFFKYYILKEKVKLTGASPSNFSEWKKEKKQNSLPWHHPVWFERLSNKDHKEIIMRESEEDLNELFDRIASHNLPFKELFDELFSWYTYTRHILSKQVRICNEKFYAFSPGMSRGILTRTSNIHPNLRLFYRFTDKLLNQEKDLKKFSKIPTGQIPIVPQNSPNFIKIPIWGLRSKIDELLVKRLMKKKNPDLRYRLFKSVNWVEVYQQKSVLQNFDDYYKDNNLTDKYYETYRDLTSRRQKLESWPFANMDIIAGAALNAEMNLIKKRNQ